jgi:hypothetical protein
MHSAVDDPLCESHNPSVQQARPKLYTYNCNDQAQRNKQ